MKVSNLYLTYEYDGLRSRIGNAPFPSKEPNFSIVQAKDAATAAEHHMEMGDPFEIQHVAVIPLLDAEARTFQTATPAQRLTIEEVDS